METVVDMASEALRSGAFNDALEAEIIKFVREGSDHGLTEIGFILKMAVHLMSRSNGSVNFDTAKRLASSAYREFLKSEEISFGDPEYDWSGASAREMADEFEADHWEFPSNG